MRSLLVGRTVRLALMLVFVPLAGCEKPPAPAKAAPAAPVIVVRPQVRTVPIEIRANGTVRVFATVAVRSQVGGELTQVHFQEGDFVKKGDLLFTIDPRPFDAQLAVSQAQLDRDVALLRGAERNFNRAEPLGTASVLSTEEIENRRTEVTSLAATVAADQASVRASKLQLEYTKINSQIDGRTGNLLITPGNLVTASQASPLVVINQLSPIAVSFAVPEQHLSAIVDNMKQQGGKLSVMADLRNGSEPLAGELRFVDNSVDMTTGMVQLKASFPNENRRLWPGQFVDIVLKLSDRPDSVTLPMAAVQEGQNGTYVFVVNKQDQANLVPVKVAFTTADGDSVIAEGLNGTETVVLDGHLRVLPGGKVAIKSDKPTSGQEESAKPIPDAVAAAEPTPVNNGTSNNNERSGTPTVSVSTGPPAPSESTTQPIVTPDTTNNPTDKTTGMPSATTDASGGQK